MAPKSIAVGRRGPTQQPGMISSLYRELRSPENASVVKSVAIFAAAVAVLQSGWDDGNDVRCLWVTAAVYSSDLGGWVGISTLIERWKSFGAFTSSENLKPQL
ncbi:hypothetical protein FN846DRAFT_595326 [Sphaerosporella brunnea]|uniref:Uncharacterized protein n=1 Tax=Sphaerosporella brunnea TaxID=1250544 RepID=A0A5J5EBM8_9PEZI|nr:hypothetical protein FN846DRAFT_595326 [Sphaerosporella brunnea]